MSALAFENPVFAARLRDVIGGITRRELHSIRPGTSYATAASVDHVARTATVVFPGEVDAVPISMGALRPAPGDRVRIEGDTGDRYISEVTSGRALVYGAAADFSGSISGAANLSLTGTSSQLNVSGASSQAIFAGVLNANGTITSSGTWIRLAKQTKVESTTGPTLTSTNHAFDIGGATDGSGLRLKFGPSEILAVAGTSAAPLNLNPLTTSGAVLARSRSLMPLLDRTSTGLVGTPPPANTQTDRLWMQAGTQTLTFGAGGQVTFSWPQAWSNGVVAFVGTLSSTGGASVSLNSAGCSTATCAVVAQINNNTFYVGSAVLSWIAIGW
jgi:hypothetical protein